MASAVIAVALAAAFGIAGCDRARPEARALIEAVDRYRAAENAGKPAAAEAIARVTCSDADVCAAKTACLANAEPTAKALTLKAEVEAGLADVKAGRLAPDDPKAKELPAKLDEASKLLEQGHAAVDACDAKITALRLRYAG